jgi:hypothetical protein
MGASSSSLRSSRPRRACISSTLLAIASTLACAEGSKGQDGSYGVFEEDGGVAETAATTFDSGDHEGPQPADDDDGADGPAPDLGACEDDDDCMAPKGSCWLNGECVDGQCQLEPSLAGQSCDDLDPCSDPDLCDGQGNCVGDSIPCTAPNASGGMCIDGACEGLACNVGFGNCNDDWEDGCEVARGHRAASS